ncbi:Piso0_005622 [Millerozyma farinosa CBS 7064]|uniref:Piso0_005622 protein n=1 Tax=Pichia sorbitophila (strain ATCC MYA-4447 / BCRC 22081 / CBS 7064 / NBRC 10061 / NRRL Y-12695) TaxID=559304 RepID=G8Y2G9_PICSO|nr:Piso0_005622 [Millerozyma farinosa CBS 7064]
MFLKYLKSKEFINYFPDWITVAGLLVIFFLIVEQAEPFQREFKVSDVSLQHPFAKKERVTDNMLYVISTLLPLSVIACLVKAQKKISKDHKFHYMMISMLGLMVSVSATGVFSDILKVWIARPRPDFLERCGAPSTVSADRYVTAKICTAPMGRMYLLDGMKSTPSAHASLSFAGLFYLSLWLFVHYEADLSVQSWKHILFFSPNLLAMYVGLSRTQDYRHHFFDIAFGTVIGISAASLSALKYFRDLRAREDVLPIKV